MIRESLKAFESLINKRINNLEKYTMKENANNHFIQSENGFISELVNIYNNLNAMKEIEKWESIEKIITQLEHKDNEISGHTINLRTKETGNNFTLITYNQTEL